MKEYELANYLIEVLDWASSEDGMVVGVDTFESAGLLTNNEGLVIKMKTGEVFQLTIKQSK
jgi:hypothetical protein